MPEIESLRKQLAERDSRCPACGYSLRGLRGGKCPECGTVAAPHEIRDSADAQVIEPVCAAGAIISLLASAALALVMYQRARGDLILAMLQWIPVVCGTVSLVVALHWLSLRRSAPLRRAATALGHGAVMWCIGIVMLFFLALFVMYA